MADEIDKPLAQISHEALIGQTGNIVLIGIALIMAIKKAAVMNTISDSYFTNHSLIYRIADLLSW